MGLFDFLFDKKRKKIQESISEGAIILDVRTQMEWDAGHIKNAKHIPVTELKNRIQEIEGLNKPIITYCKSGVRSAKAASYLNLNNFKAINGGAYRSLSKIIS